MKESTQIFSEKAPYEEPKLDVVLFTSVNTNTPSGDVDEDEGEWDEVG